MNKNQKVRRPGNGSKWEAKRTPFEIERDRATIANLYLQGNTQQEIAGKLNLSRDAIQHDLMRIREQWQKSTIYDFNDAKTKALAELDHLKAVAWDAWERSKKGRKKTSQSETRPGGAKRGEVTATVANEETYGDPRYLQTVRDAISEQCKLLGLYPETNKLTAGLPDGAAGQASVVYLPSFETPKPVPADAQRN